MAIGGPPPAGTFLNLPSSEVYAIHWLSDEKAGNKPPSVPGLDVPSNRSRDRTPKRPLPHGPPSIYAIREPSRDRRIIDMFCSAPHRVTGAGSADRTRSSAHASPPPSMA